MLTRIATLIGFVCVFAALAGFTAADASAAPKDELKDICALMGWEFWETDGSYGCSNPDDGGDGCVYDTAEPGGKTGSNNRADGPSTAYECYADGNLVGYGLVVERSGVRTFDPAAALRAVSGYRPPPPPP